MTYKQTIGSLAFSGYLALFSGFGTITGMIKGAYHGAKQDAHAMMKTFKSINYSENLKIKKDKIPGTMIR